MFKDEANLIEILTARKNQTYGADSLRDALRELGDPHLNLKIIQIGGTNGKGSTSNFCRSILEKSSYRVGTFTSPHLVHHRDRIRINNNDIPKDIFIKLANDTLPLWDKYNLSMFEIDLIIAVLYFLNEDVDCAIFEVGLGGRLDATSVLYPKVIGITNVSLDHMQILGDTVEKITLEKAGIFKKGVPVISSVLDSRVKKVLQDESLSSIRFLKAPHFYRKNGVYYVQGEKADFKLRRHAEYQIYNANLAISLCYELYPNLSLEDIQEAVENEVWAGRFEMLIPGVYVDGAHNLAGIEAFVNEVKKTKKKSFVVFAALRDKEIREMVDLLSSSSDEILLTTFDFPRAAKVSDLESLGDHQIIADYKEAIDLAISKRDEYIVYVTGSLYFISVAREYIKGLDIQA